MFSKQIISFLFIFNFTFSGCSFVDAPITEGEFQIAMPTAAQNEKDSVISSALSYAITNKNVPDYDLVKKNPGIFIVNQTIFSPDSSSSSISTSALPSLYSCRFVLISPEEIQSYADNHEDFVYLSVSWVDIDGSEATVSVATEWAIGKDSKNKVVLSGGGYDLKLVKQNNVWVFNKILFEWIS